MISLGEDRSCTVCALAASWRNDGSGCPRSSSTRSRRSPSGSTVRWLWRANARASGAPRFSARSGTSATAGPVGACRNPWPQGRKSVCAPRRCSGRSPSTRRSSGPTHHPPRCLVPPRAPLAPVGPGERPGLARPAGGTSV